MFAYYPYYSQALPLLTLLATSAGCAVYVPTVPSTPLVEKGQMEISAGLRSLSSLEMGAAWSPVPHLLVSGEAAIQHFEDNQVQNGVLSSFIESHKQMGIGVGAYTLTKSAKPLYLAALGGVGTAKADVHEVNLFGPNDRFQAQYQRYYLQFYLANKGPQLVWGASLRGTWVDYNQLLRQGKPVTSIANFFLEPHLFMRYGNGPLQGYATLGASMPTTRDGAASRSATRALAPSSALVSVGIVFRPLLLQQRDK